MDGDGVVHDAMNGFSRLNLTDESSSDDWSGEGGSVQAHHRTSQSSLNGGAAGSRQPDPNIVLGLVAMLKVLVAYNNYKHIMLGHSMLKHRRVLFQRLVYFNHLQLLQLHSTRIFLKMFSKRYCMFRREITSTTYLLNVPTSK